MVRPSLCVALETDGYGVKSATAARLFHLE